MPNNLYLYVGVDPGIPLVPPTVVGFINGGGLGMYGLADTVAMDSLAIPPIKFRGTVGGSIVDVFEGKADATVGPSGFELQFTDVKIADAIDVIDSMGVFGNISYEKQNFKDNDYTGMAMDMGGKLGIALKVGDKTFLSAEGESKMGAFSGIRIDNNKCFVMSKLYAANKLNGSIVIPEGLVRKWLPPWDIKLFNRQIEMYIGGTTVTEMDPRASIDNVFRSSVKNFTLNGSVSATDSYNLLVTEIWVRASYVFGGKPSIEGGTGSPPENKLSVFEVGDDTMPSGTAAQFITNDDGEKSGAFVVETNEYVAASSKDSGVSTMEFTNNAGSGVQLSNAAADESSYDITIDETAKYLFRLTPKEGASFDTNLANGGFVLEKITDGNPVNVPLVEISMDQSENITGNFGVSADSGFFGIPNDLGVGTYRIRNNSAFDVEAVGFTPFAAINADETAVSANTLSYKLNDRDEEKNYAVSVWLGKEKGATDYLLAETPRNDNGDYIPISGDSGNIALTSSGTAAPTGNYYMTVQLLEQITAKDGDDIASSWVIADNYGVAENFDYTYLSSPDAPQAPENITVSYEGNETLRAQWNAVDNADGYIVSVYDENGNNMDMQYVTAADVTQVDMALTRDSVQYTGEITEGVPIDESKMETVSGLTAGEKYKIGVSAYTETTLNGQPESEDNKPVRINGIQGMSDAALLPAAIPPQLTYSKNVTFDENHNGTLILNNSENSFTVTAKPAKAIDDNNVVDRAVTFTARVDGTESMIPVEVTGKTCTVNVPDFEGSQLIALTATDSAGDKTTDYISVMVDNEAPILTLDDKGTFAVCKNAEDKYSGYVTGLTESGAGIFTWVDGKQINAYADNTGVFSIPIISDTATVDIKVQAVDAAGNGSDVLQAKTEEQPLSDEDILATLKTAVEGALADITVTDYISEQDILNAANEAIAPTIYRANAVVEWDETGKIKLGYGTAETSIPVQITILPLSILSLDGATAEIFAPRAMTDTLVFACYNENGELIDISIKRGQELSAGKAQYSAPAAFAASSERAAKISVFLWKDPGNLRADCVKKSYTVSGH